MSKKKFNFSLIKKRRNEIANLLLEKYVGVSLVGGVVHALATDLTAMLPATVSQVAVFDTVRVLAGTMLDAQTAKTIAWRIAGNVDQLIDGQAVLAWTRQLHDEIVPVSVENVLPTKRKNDFGYIFQCRVLAGSSCPMLFSQFVSSRGCRALSRVVGFSNTPWGLHQYAGIGQYFVKLQFYAHVEAARSRDKPVFHQISVSSGMLKHNKQLIEVRCRTKPCPDGFEHACVNCPTGYGECSFAVHPHTYVEQHCRNCDKVEFFDPESPGVMCLACQKRSGFITQ
jgi:hypothetical protein